MIPFSDNPKNTLIYKKSEDMQVEFKLYHSIKPYNKILICVFSFFITFLYLFFKLDILNKTNLKVYFLNIGQGDSEMIVSPTGNSFLIDTGPDSRVVEKVENSVSYLNQSFNSVMLTHSDSDHVAGYVDVERAFNIKNLYISRKYSKQDTLKNFKYLSFGDKILLGESELNIVSPKNNMLGDDNHTSIVSYVKYGNYRFIFMADADKEIERELVSDGVFNKPNEYIDILKVGHHGSDTSSSEIFLKSLKPEYCVISAGKNNKYGHPKPNTMIILEKYCKNIYKTYEDGTILFQTDGKMLKIKTS